MPAPTDTRTRFLDAALRLLRQKGYASTRVDDLCEATGLTKGAFFHHFKSKEALALAAADHFQTTADAAFAGAPYQDISDPKERLLGYVDFRIAILEGDLPDVSCLLGMIVQEAYETHPALSAACGSHIEAHAASLTETIEDAREQYAPGATWDADGLTFHIQGVIQGAFVLAKAQGSLDVAVESLQHLRRYLDLVFDSRVGNPA